MRKGALLASCFLTALVAANAAPAWAQDQGGSAGSGTSDRSGDIIVTARRVEERLQEVPISITVYNQQQLNERNVVNATDLAKYTPSLQTDTRFGSSNASFAIRGFRQELRTTASVGVYFGDVVAQRGGLSGSTVGDGGGPGYYFDLQNVQVLKGPQGTLFGRNTTGGAIILVPRKPTAEFDGYVQGTYGNYDQKRVEAVVNVPLGDTARFRMGVDWNDRDGYQKNTLPIGPSRFGDQNYIAARASLVVDLTPDLENYTIVSYARSRDNGVLPKITDCGGSLAFLCAPQLARESEEGFWVGSNTLQNPISELTQWQVINTVTWNASDSLRVKSITSYGQLESLQRISTSGVGYLVPGGLGLPAAYVGLPLSLNVSSAVPGGDTGAQENFTQELQLQGNIGDGQLVWQAGAYFENSTPLRASGTQSPSFLYCDDDAQVPIQNAQCVDPLALAFGQPLGSLNYNVGSQELRSIGLYAQGTYKLSEQFKLTAGLRYTWDRTISSGQLLTYRFAGPTGLPLADPTVTCGVASETDTVADLVYGPDNDCRVGGRQNSKAPTWVLGLDYTPTDDIMIYGKYSRGYRQGAFSFNAPIGYQAFRPEKVDAFEAGIKTSWSGAVRGTFNISAFYNKFSDQQVGVAFASLTNAVAPTIVAINVGKSRIYGLEVDASISPFTGFRIDASYAYLNTKVLALDPDALPPTPGIVPGTRAYGLYDYVVASGVTVGDRLAQVPSNKLSVTATLDLPVPESVGEISLSATYTYTDDYLYGTSTSAAADFGILPSNELINANATWNKVFQSPVDLSLFVTNLTNKKYYVAINDNLAQAGSINRYVGEPRMYGLRVKYSFR